MASSPTLLDAMQSLMILLTNRLASFAVNLPTHLVNSAQRVTCDPPLLAISLAKAWARTESAGVFRPGWPPFEYRLSTPSQSRIESGAVAM